MEGCLSATPASAISVPALSIIGDNIRTDANDA